MGAVTEPAPRALNLAEGATSTAPRALGYARVSTTEQSSNGHGIEAQEDAIRSAARARGWDLVDVVQERGVSGKSIERPGLAAALHDLDARRADLLVVAKLDRLTRSLVDFSVLLERVRRSPWQLVALDLGVDTSTPAGELVANVMAAVAQWERRAIGERTKDGLAAARARGVVLGRPPAVPGEVEALIVARRADGWGPDRIAAWLNEQQVPTARGGAQWYGSTVTRVLKRVAA